MNTACNAVVLGASSGVGAACMRSLKRWGYSVTGFHRGRHQAEADAVEQETHGLMIRGDVGSDVRCVIDGVDALVLRDRPPVDVLVHSLSGGIPGAAVMRSPSEVEATFFRMAHSFLFWAQELHRRGLFAPRATLVALSNPVADNYLTNSGVIGAAKAALEAYVKILAVELGFHHTVIGVRFGAVVTPSMEAVVPKARETMEKLHWHIMPRGTMLTAAEVAEVVTRLASPPDMSMLNGAIIDLTGGSHLTLMDYAFGRRRD